MKPKLIDRFILAILLIFIILLAIGLVALAIGTIPEEGIIGVLDLIYLYDINKIIVSAIAVVLLILALRLMFAGRGGSASAEPVPQMVLVRRGDNGATYMSIAAIDSMVQKHCRANNKIRDCFSLITPTNDNVTIKLRLTLMPDVNIPEFSESLQKSLKEYIETLSGIFVMDISILVESVNPNNKISARVD